MRSERFDFAGAGGDRLIGRLELPEGDPATYAVFAHCFTCGKDVRAAAHIARTLAELGIATLRFDFTGLGGSGGEFANTTFTSNIADLVAAADALARTRAAPSFLIGHSLGGAATLAAVDQISSAAAVVTIGAPFDTAHVLHLLKSGLPAIEEQGEAEVVIAGRSFRVRRELVRDLAAQDQARRIAALRRPLLVMHAPTDDIVGIESASAIFQAAKHPKSFVSLDTADHLLSQPADAAYAARVLAAWASRHVGAMAGTEATRVPAAAEAVVEEGTVLVEETGRGRFQQRVTAGRHVLLADEPEAVGGLGSGPGPYDLLLAGLGACSAMTVRLYAERKGWPLERVSVRLSHGKIHARDCADCETRGDARIDEIRKAVVFTGPLDTTQRARLLEIVDHCPVHRTLTSEVKIRTAEEEP
jgi:putative redox protein